MGTGSRQAPSVALCGFTTPNPNALPSTHLPARAMGPMPMIYLDNNATTRLHPEVLEAMMPFLTEAYANPSSGYQCSHEVKKAVDLAREQVASLLGADRREIIFTSGGTEADNTAIASSIACLPDRQHLVASTVEHPAVMQFLEMLEREHGHPVTLVPVDGQGLLDLDELEAAIRPNETGLLSLMWANNETGVFFPIPEIAARLADKGIFFHTDAVQAVGKTPINLQDAGIHFLALSGHKFHGPKGVGALYVSSRVRLRPRIIGGAQESNRRGGTENVAGIVGLGKAAELMASKLANDGHLKMREERDYFEAALKRRLSGVHVNGHPELRLSNTANLAFDGIEAQALLIKLDEEDICASAGSACHTGSLHASPILTAMGFDRERALGTTRFSLSSFTTREELDRAIEVIVRAVERLRQLRPTASVAHYS